MGWFWGSKPNKSDPTESLSPELRDFLATQQPRPYVPAEPSSPAPDIPPEVKPVELPDTNKTYEERSLPKESLFQDGRYTHLWKTYVPQSEIAAATSTPVERILAARKDRRSMIQRAAMENCAFEHELQLNCLHAGDLANRARARLTLCRQEAKAFNRCFQLQAKFLQALGYYSSTNTTEEDEERIQMHADTLYHRMMDYEADVEEARHNGNPIPPLSSVFDSKQPAPTLEQLHLPSSVEKKITTPLHQLPPHERELAVRAALEEARMSNLYADEFTKFSIEMNEGRKRRQEWLIRVFGEPIGKFIIPDPPQSTDRRTLDPERLGSSPSDDQPSALDTRTKGPAASDILKKS